MFNDPEFANKEEWDAYAWFGFALSEAQTIERLLQVVATAISMNTIQGTDRSRHWATLYDSFGRLTLGTLLNKVKSCSEVQLSKDLVQRLYEVRDTRNRLTHSFFRLSDSAAPSIDTLEMATRVLQAAASSFRHASTQLELEVHEILHQLRVTRVEAEVRLAKRLKEEGSGGNVQ